MRENPQNRCYFCKQAIFSALIEAARGDGYTAVMDGTNASDDAGDRPGMRALKELNVLSPLRLCGVTKAQVRAYSREAGLFTWDKPAYACLATRVPAGTAITAELLARVEGAEAALFDMGFTDFRVRVFHGAARLQLPADQLARVVEGREAIRRALAPWFETVLLDLKDPELTVGAAAGEPSDRGAKSGKLLDPDGGIMNRDQLLEALRAVQAGDMTPEAALGLFAQAPYEDIGYAKIDHHRGLRNGSGEVIYGAGKTAEQIAGIVERMLSAGGENILITRMDGEKADFVAKSAPLFYDELARVGIANRVERPLVGSVVVASGGTSDLAVCEEAALTAETLGSRVTRLYDVGVAGLHRLLSHMASCSRPGRWWPWRAWRARWPASSAGWWTAR